MYSRPHVAALILTHTAMAAAIKKLLIMLIFNGILVATPKLITAKLVSLVCIVLYSNEVQGQCKSAFSCLIGL